MKRADTGTHLWIRKPHRPVHLSVSDQRHAVHRYVCPAYPEWQTAEVHLSMGLLGLYIVIRKMILGETRDRWGRQIRRVEKTIKVYIGVSVVASLIFALIMSMFG